MGRGRSAHRAWLREQHTPTIVAFCEDLGLRYEKVHGFDWHIRIEGIMDVFPTSNKYHLLKTDERGRFNDYEELGRIFEDYITKEEI